jgi:hypothetical protein
MHQYWYIIEYIVTISVSRTSDHRGCAAVSTMMLGLGLFLASAVIAAAVADPGWTAAQEQPPGPWPNCTAGVLPKQAVYSVVVTRRDPVPDNAALISHVNHTSTFNFSFTTAWFPAPPTGSNGSDLGEGLVVRVVGTSVSM